MTIIECCVVKELQLPQKDNENFNVGVTGRRCLFGMSNKSNVHCSEELARGRQLKLATLKRDTFSLGVNFINVSCGPKMKAFAGTFIPYYGVHKLRFHLRYNFDTWYIIIIFIKCSR